VIGGRGYKYGAPLELRKRRLRDIRLSPEQTGVCLINTAASARCMHAASRPSPESFRGFLPPKQTVETVGAPRAPLYTGLKPRC